jgi:hypothetical protein
MLVNMTATDLDLLGQFTREQSQDAFTDLVSRHLNLVYSAALRQVRSPQLAEEVSQSVFTNLARNAVLVDHKFVARRGLHFDDAQRIEARLLARAGDGGNLLAIVTNGESD